MTLKISPTNKLALVLFGSIVLISVLAVFIRPNQSPAPVRPGRPENNQNIPAAGPVSIKGHIGCLPKNNTGSFQTMECLYGLRDDSGKYYSLKTANLKDQNLFAIPENEEVTVQGNFSPSTDTKYQTVGIIDVSSISRDHDDWKTYTDPRLKLTYRYPEKIPTEFIDTTDWPPRLNIVDRAFSCQAAGSVTAPAGKTQTQEINGRTYCVTSKDGAAAGSIYTQYAYAAAYQGKTAILTFSLRFVQCGNYEDPQKTACEQERGVFDIGQTVDAVMQTIR